MSEPLERPTPTLVEQSSLAKGPPALDVKRIGKNRSHLMWLMRRNLKLHVMSRDQFVRHNHLVEVLVEIAKERFFLFRARSCRRCRKKKNCFRIGCIRAG